MITGGWRRCQPSLFVRNLKERAAESARQSGVRKVNHRANRIQCHIYMSIGEVQPMLREATPNNCHPLSFIV